MLNELPDEDNRIGSFVEALSRMPDRRDNRGKKRTFPGNYNRRFYFGDVSGAFNPFSDSEVHKKSYQIAAGNHRI